METPPRLSQVQMIPKALEALKAGNKIEAIKIVRAATGVGLAEAKAIVDRTTMHAAHQAASPHSRTGLSPGQVPDSPSPGKWFAAFAIAAIVIGAVLYT